MKRLAIISFVFFAMQLDACAQQWEWVTGDTSVTSSVNTPGLVAAGKNAILWAPFVKTNLIYGSVKFGKYSLKEYDTAGNPGNTLTLDGKVSLLDAQCDSDGNYYLLGYYYDTITFSNGFQVTRSGNGPAPDHFLFRLDKHTLALTWFKFLGTDNSSVSSCFTIKNGSLYAFVDSAQSTDNLYKYDLSSGAATLVLSQTGDGFVSSLQIDDNNNIYVAGSGVSLASVNFNGRSIIPPPSFSYPAYIVRYNSNGSYDWSKILSDVTIVQRKLSLANNNTLYYSGVINDSFTLDGFHVHHPVWVYDYLVSAMDSTGSVQWLTQLSDSLTGDARLINAYHAVVGQNGSLSVASSVRNAIDWGNGVISNCSLSGNATVVNYARSGAVNWAISAYGLSTQPGYINTDGNNIWLSGIGYDSTALTFGALTIPSAVYMYSSFLSKIGPNTAVTTSVNRTTLPLSVNVFPDPASGYLNVQCIFRPGATATISLLDLTGKVVYCKNHTTQEINFLNVSAYSRGIYFLEVVSGVQRFVRKVILE